MIALTPDQEAAIRRVASAVWPVEKLAALCAAWVSGESTRLIGIRLGVTKSAVVGKAHRLRAWGVIEGRSDPIIRDGRPGVDRAPHVGAVTLPPLAALSAPAVVCFSAVPRIPPRAGPAMVLSPLGPPRQVRRGEPFSMLGGRVR